MGVWDVDLSSMQAQTDLRHNQIFGYPEGVEEWTPDLARNHMVAEDREKFDQQYQKALKTGIMDMVIKVRWPDGSLHWVYDRGKTYYDESGKPVRLTGVSIEITEQKHAEEMIRESEERFRALVTASADVVYRMSPDWSVMRELGGKGFLSDTTEPSTSWREGYILPEDQDTVNASIQDAIRDKKVFELEHRVIRADGSIGWTFSRAVPMMDKEGNIVEWFGTASDVSARKESEERQSFSLKLSDAMRSLTDAAKIQATVTDIIRDYFEADRCYYCALEGDSAIIQKDASRQGMSSVAGEYPLSSMPVFKAVLDAGQPFVVHDVHTTELVDEELRQLCIQMKKISFIDVPIIKDGQPVGIFCIIQAKPWEWTETDVELAEETAERTWAAVERARAEEALQKSKERLQKAISIPTVGVIFFDLEGKIHDGNEAFQRMSGYTLEDLKSGKVRWDELTPPEFMEVTEKSLEEFRSKWENIPYEKQYIRPDGTRWWGLFAGIRLSENECVEFVLDISESKKAEQELHRSEENLAAIFQEAEAGISEISPEGRFLRVNDKLCRILGRSRKELLQLSIADVTLPEYLPHSQEALERLLKTAEPESLNKFYIKPDGSRVWANSALSLLNNKENNQSAVLAITVDLTEQRKAEEALRKSEERFQLATATGNMYSWELDIDTQELQYSGSTSSVIGLSTATGLPKNLDGMMQIIHNDDLERVKKEFELGQKEAKTFCLTFRIKKGHNIIWLEKTARVFRDQQGKAKRIIGIAQNITDRKLAEEALEKAKNEAERAARAKEEFLSTMSHEIRTPLNAINGLTNLLLQKSPRPDQEENLNTLKFSSHNLLMLINDILDYSKIEAGKVELEYIDYQLSTLVDSIRQAHLPLAEGKDNELHIHIADNVPDVLRGDPHKLVQILNNLISNAIKFTEHGSIYLTVSLEKLEKEKAWLHFEVRDTGIGISEGKIEAIFEKFTQADSSTVRRYGGTGLGLSITKSLLELMGSKIVVKSKEGEGSVFSFTLRLEMGNRANLRKLEHIYTENKKDKARLKNLKMLLVEDAEINRMVVLQHLEAWWDLEADEAINGKEAVKKAKKTKYDLILMDKRMPEMDGVEATRRIRKLSEHYARIPIIVLTADAYMKGEVTESGDRDTLFDALVTKPFEPDQLMKTILSQIGERAPIASTSTKKEASALKTDIFTPDFSKAEGTFKGSTEQKKVFYQKVIDSLQSYQIEYLKALEQQDEQQLEDSMHRAKMMFAMLGLEGFYQQMYEVREQVEEGTSTKELKNDVDKIRQALEEVISKIRKRFEELSYKS